MEPMPAFNLLRPETLDQLVEMRQQMPDARLLAGGTDLVPNIRRGIERPPAVIDLNGVDELATIAVDADGGLRIGAAVTLAAVGRSEAVNAGWPVLAVAAETVAGPTHREVATVGGNLCLDTRCVYYNQSEWWRNANDFCLKKDGSVCHVAPKSAKCFAAFSGDLAPAAIVLDATVEVAGPAGQRTLPLPDLYREDGANHLCLDAGEVVVAVRVPAPDGRAADYAKVRQRGSIDFPLIGIAVAVRREGQVLTALRIAFTGTNSRPLPIEGTEALAGAPLDDAGLEQIARLAAKQLQPMKSTFTPQTYRRRVALNLLRRLTTNLYDAAA